MECHRSLRRRARRFWANRVRPRRTVPRAAGRAKTVNPTKSETPAKDRVAVDITPGLNPMADVRFMEVMIGTKRQFVLFNGPGNSPVVHTQDDGSAKAGAVAAPAAARKKARNRLRMRRLWRMVFAAPKGARRTAQWQSWRKVRETQSR